MSWNKLLILSFVLFFSCTKGIKEENPYFLYLKYRNFISKGEIRKAVPIIKYLSEKYPSKEYKKEYITVLYKLREYYKVNELFVDFYNTYGFDKDLTYLFLSSCTIIKDYEKFSKYEKLLRKEIEKDKDLLYMIALLYLAQKNYERADSIFSILIDIDPVNRIDYLTERVRIRVDLKEYQSAMRIIKEIERERGELSYPLLIEKGIIYENTGDKEKAFSIYRRALLLNPSNKRLKRKVINIALELKKIDIADSLLSEALKNTPFDLYLLHQKGYIDYIKEDYISALKIFSLIVLLNPKDDISHYYLSRIFYRLKDTKKAVKHIDKAIEINPVTNEYKVYKAFLLVSSKKLREAQELLRKIRAKEDPSYYYLKGFIERQKKNYKKAIYYFRKSLKLDSTDADRWFELGALYERIKDIKKAIECFKKSVRLDSTLAEAYNYWGYILAERGEKLDTAEILIRKALKYEPENGYYLDSMGWVYFMRGMYDSARVYIEKAVKYVSDDPVILEHLGDIYFKLNDIEKAIEYWNRALKILPDNRILREKIKRKTIYIK